MHQNTKQQKNESLNIRVPYTTARRVRLFAAHTNQQISEVVRTAIDRYVTDRAVTVAIRKWSKLDV